MPTVPDDRVLLWHPKTLYAPSMNTRYPWTIVLALLFFLAGCATEKVGISDQDFEPPPDCTSEVPTPGPECVGTAPEANACESAKGELVETPRTLGSPHPNWTLPDVHPASCGYEQYYGLSTFRGTPTMVVLLWAGCGFCRAQAAKLQEMHDELSADGVDIDFIIIDRAADNPPIDLLVEVCNFPIFQDVESVDAWGLHEGVKDDFFFYNADGILEILIPAWGDVEMNLATEAGYRNIKSAALVISGRDPLPVPMEEDTSSDSMPMEADTPSEETP